jgi:hypothetical protein
MAIIYSYPLADEVTNDSWVLGSEMDNGQRVVKNYSVGDIAAFIQEQFTTTPTLQEVTDQGANTTIQMQINGVDVATVNDIPGIPTLQEVTDVGSDSYGNTINLKHASNSDSLIQFNVGSFFEPYIKIENMSEGSAGHYMRLGSSTIEFNGDEDYNTILEVGAGLNNVITLPSESGTLALTSDISVPYKVYTALINQNGTAAPFVIDVLENTLSGTVTFEYTNPGLYFAVLEGEFASNKTTALLWGGTGGQLFKAARTTSDRILLVTYNTSGVPENNQMGVTTLEIRVYN